MNKLSSRMTFYYKRIFPVIWFGILGTVFVGMMFSLGGQNAPPLPVLLMPTVMAVFGFVIMKLLVFSLVDEVLDAGEVLVVRNRNDEEKVPLSDIRNVSYSRWTNPHRVTLSLRRDTKFGREISFMPRVRWNVFAPDPMIENLIERIDKMR